MAALTTGAGLLARRESRSGLLFIAPWILGFLVFSLGPMIASLYLSFCKYDLHRLECVGAENYRRLLTSDPLFWRSLQNTILYVVFSVPLGLAGSLLIAILLNQNVRGQRVFRTFFYLPSLVPAVASSLLWLWVLNSENGLLNYGLMFLGVPHRSCPRWLEDPAWTLPAFVLMSLWGIGGAKMIIFLAGLQGISESYYEAAHIDGASNWQKFLYITLPMLSPTIFFNLILGIIGSFQVFTSAYVMTSGGPSNASLFYVLYLFRNAFEYFKLGKASAMAWILFALLLGFTVVQFKNARRWVHYEAGHD